MNNNIEAIIDDRDNLSLGNRINDVALLGTPKIIILGKKYDNENYEVEDVKTNNVELVNKNNIVTYLNSIEK